MRLSDLQTFVDIVEFGSMTRAARERGISQPGMSRIVRELEHRTRATLLRRTGRGIELTAAGELFLNFCRAVLDAYGKVGAEIESLTPGVSQRIRISIPLGIGSFLTAPLQRQFALEIPKLSVDVFEERSSLQTDTQLLRHYDLSITFGAINDASSIGKTLFREDLYLVGDPNLIGDKPSPIQLSDVAQMPLMLPPISSFRTLVDTTFRGAGYLPIVGRELESSGAMLAFAMEKEGVAILPYSNLLNMISEGNINARLIVNPCISRTIRLIWKTNHEIFHKSAIDLISRVLNTFAEKARWNPLS